MRYLFYILILVIAPSAGFSQSKIDSLENELNKNQDDSIKVSILLQLSKASLSSDFSKSLRYAEQAAQIAEEKKLNQKLASAYSNLGTLFTISGDYTSALKLDNLALKQSLSTKDTSDIAANYNAIANDYYDLGEYDEAFYYFTQAHRLARITGDSLTMAIALHNIARVFKELGEYEKALTHLRESERISKIVNDVDGPAYTLHELGDLQLRRGAYDSALTTLNQSLRLIRKLKIRVLEPRTLTIIATAHLNKRNFQEALVYYDSTYQLHSRISNQYGMAEVELGRGSVFAAQGKFDQATERINNSLQLAKKSNARILQIRCYNQLAEIWEKKGQYQRSLQYFKLFKQLEDSLFNHDMQSKLLRDQIRFETEAKDSQIAALSRDREKSQDELKRQEFIRNILVVVVALTVILLATVYRSGQRRRQINELLLNHQQETEKRSEELERLNQVKDKFFSIISHDLRSPINALSGLLDLLDKGAVKPEELPNHVRELKTRFNHTRTLLNNLLDWTLLQMDKLNLQPSKIDLHKIVDENIQLLSSVQTKQIRMLNTTPTPCVAFADSNTTNLVIRNLVTNALKFTNDGGVITISADEKDDHWQVSVKDNGIGIDHDVLKILFDKTAPYTTRGTANEKGTGLGLILCKEFVEKNGGKIWVESEVGAGSTFIFTIPKAS